MGRIVPLENQKGNITEETIKKKQLAEESVFVGNEQLENPPGWLINEVAVNEWKRLVKEFNKKSLISNLDYNNLGAYCNAFARYTDIVKKLGTKVLVGKENHPLVQLELKYSDEMKKYGSLLGLTMESRLKMGSGIVTKKEEQIENVFGEI